MASNPSASALDVLDPSGDRRAAVVVVPDFGSRSASYARFDEYLAAHAIASCALDTRRWSGSFAAPANAIGELVARIRARHPSLPLFLMGHGAGAVTACQFALDHGNELDGLICEAMALDLPMPAPLAGLMRLVSPLLPGVAAASLIRAAARLKAGIARLSTPLLVLHGAADPVALASGSELLHARAGSCDKTLQVFEGYHHDLINDHGHEIARDKACQWIEARLGGGSCRRQIGIEYINEQP